MSRDRDPLLGAVVETHDGARWRVIASDLSRVRIDAGHGLRFWMGLAEFHHLVNEGALTPLGLRQAS